MPYSGTIQDLTFNLFSILADQRLSANALLWITVWITAVGHGPGTASRGSSFAARASWTPNRGYWAWLPDLDRIVLGAWSALMSYFFNIEIRFQNANVRLV